MTILNFSWRAKELNSLTKSMASVKPKGVEKNLEFSKPIFFLALNHTRVSSGNGASAYFGSEQSVHFRGHFEEWPGQTQTQKFPRGLKISELSHDPPYSNWKSHLSSRHMSPNSSRLGNYTGLQKLIPLTGLVISKMDMDGTKISPQEKKRAIRKREKGWGKKLGWGKRKEGGGRSERFLSMPRINGGSLRAVRDLCFSVRPAIPNPLRGQRSSSHFSPRFYVLDRESEKKNICERETPF